MRTISILLLMLLFAPAAYAEEESMKDQCEVTPAVWQLKRWPTISKSNNLRRHTGGVELARGDYILLTGMVTDRKCVPVAGAIIQIWQADSLGIMKDFAPDHRKRDKKFINTGTAITDNFGGYSFLTVLPGALNDRAPFINFKILHKDFLPLETVMFFENQAYNDFDHILNYEVNPNKRHLLVAKGEKIYNNDDQEGIKYQFDITLEGKNKYLKY